MNQANQDSLQDLSISGIGGAAGGVYKSIHLDGVCKVLADVEAETFEANGVITARGNVQAKKIDINGKMRIEGGLRSGSARIDGMLRVESGVYGEQLNMNGMLTCGADCTAEKFDARGCVDIKGLLSADSIDVELQGKCTAREIGGEQIRITKGPGNRWAWLLKWAIPRLVTQFETELIEGDVIELEHTAAAVVRGNRVKIGKGCTIGRVEYRSEIDVHPQAKVSEQVQA
ncbi:hypothetical protein COLU111180_10525 [Cohnella lubricantis]|uniref:Polymer-forming cytoskeletal protein n=1 Tax=Cohnella lubricantis TaxID=2163172 RepID=A0A841TAI0_9BACL|nr:hypothetical protein [Cohnella lubricantis]MBB6678493.1 hypothetical protein [Cohnella lubricantis]MBP2118416.1 cytoskeletal protein CcmA (bactofilin family) [Cohnella lubricantis]